MLLLLFSDGFLFILTIFFKLPYRPALQFEYE